MIQGNQLVGFREGKNLAQLFPRHQHFSCFTVNIGIFSKIGRRQSAWFLPPLISPRHQIVLIRLPFILTQKQIVLSCRQIVLHWKPFVLPRKQSVSSQKPFVLTQKQIVLRRNQIVLRRNQIVLRRNQIVLRRNQIVLRWKPFVLSRQQSVLSQKPFGLSWKHFMLTSQQMILLPIRKQICPQISPLDAKVSILSGESGTPRAAAGHRKPVGVFPHPSPRPPGDADKMGFAFRGDWEKLTENSMGFLGFDSARQKPSNL